MTGPFGTPRPMPRLPTPPTGWPIGSYQTYAEAQRAVDHLADNQFPVAEVTIVGVDLMLVERVLSRLTWGLVLRRGAMLGAWIGLLVGALLSFYGSQAGAGAIPILFWLATCAVAGVVFAAAGYAATRGRRDFASSSQLVAGRYDVLCQPKHAEQARDMLAKLAMGPGPAPA